MRVLVWELGYVGTVTAACLAQMGHQVVGIGPNARKVETLNAGKSPVPGKGSSGRNGLLRLCTLVLE